MLLTWLPAHAASAGGFEYTVENGAVTLTGYTDSSVEELVIPDQLAGYPVTALGDRVFMNCENLKVITLPASVTQVGDYTFFWMKNLTAVKVSEENQAFSSDDNGALYDKEKRTLLRVPHTVSGEYSIAEGVEVIGPNAFEECVNMTGVIIPEGVKILETGAFGGCTGLTDVVLPDGVTFIGTAAFQGSSNLKSINMPESVTAVGGSVFMNCPLEYTGYEYGNYLGNETNPYHVLIEVNYIFGSDLIIHEQTKVLADGAVSWKSGLTSAVLPEGLVGIGSMFVNCDNLVYNVYDNAQYIGTESNPYFALIKAVDQNITTCNIHPQAEIIAGSAFAQCSLLTTITIPQNVKAIGQEAFHSARALETVYFRGNAPRFDGKVFSYYRLAAECTTACYPENNPTWTAEAMEACVQRGWNFLWNPYELRKEPVTLTGSVSAPANSTGLSVQLWQDGVLSYTALINDGTYSIENVASGNYLLVVSMDNGVSRTYPLEADEGAIQQDVKIHLIGDVNGDGRINVGDVSRIYAYSKKNGTLTDYEFLCADVNSDGRVNVGDASRAYGHSKKTSSLW